MKKKLLFVWMFLSILFPLVNASLLGDGMDMESMAFDKMLVEEGPTFTDIFNLDFEEDEFFNPDFAEEISASPLMQGKCVFVVTVSSSGECVKPAIPSMTVILNSEFENNVGKSNYKCNTDSDCKIETTQIEILDNKVSEEGVGSLTPEEKKLYSLMLTIKGNVEKLIDNAAARPPISDEDKDNDGKNDPEWPKCSAFIKSAVLKDLEQIKSHCDGGSGE